MHQPGKFYCAGRVRRARVLPLVLAGVLSVVLPAQAQTLRFGNHRDITPPEALLRIGPFYSSVTFSQSAGYRYTRSAGIGTDFLYENRRGEFLKDGSEFPLVTTLDLRNYVIITRQADLDVSVNVSYSHYPLKTEEDQLNIQMAPEGMYGDISTEFVLDQYFNLKGTAYDNILYRTDYIDTRGIIDRYGGQRYTHFNNVAGVNLDWLIEKNSNVGLLVSREDSMPLTEAFKSQQRVTYAETAMIEHKFNLMVVAGLQAGFNQNTYTYTGTNRPDTASSGYSAFTTVKLTERSVGSASVGYSIGEIKDGGAGEESSDGTMTGQLSVQTKLGPCISHVFGYSRSQRAGFNSPFEVYNACFYNIAWKEDLMSAAFSTTLSDVDPRSTTVNGWSDWTTDITVSYPLIEYATLDFSSSYSVRNNKQTPDMAAMDLEWRNNYATWTTRIGTSLNIFQDLVFSTYVQHIMRTSDAAELEYTRDIFEATLTFTHQF